MIDCNCGLYIIENLDDKKVYIGSSKNLKRRKYLHFWYLKHNQHCNNHLQYAWNKYGESSFNFRVLVYLEESELLEMEKRTIDLYRSYDRNYGYNLVVDPITTKHSDETIQKMSEFQSNRKRKPHSEEAKKKMSLAKQNIKQSEESKHKRSLSMTGKIRGPMTEEHKRKLSLAHMGQSRPCSEETKRKIGLAHQNRNKNRNK